MQNLIREFPHFTISKKNKSKETIRGNTVINSKRKNAAVKINGNKVIPNSLLAP